MDENRLQEIQKWIDSGEVPSWRTVEQLIAEVRRLRGVLGKVEQDVNWMMNERKLLNPEVFKYLHDEMDD